MGWSIINYIKCMLVDEDLCLQLSLRQKKQTQKNVCFQHNKLKIFPLWIIFPLQNRGHKIREMPTMKKTKTIFLVIYFLMSCFCHRKGICKSLQKFSTLNSTYQPNLLLSANQDHWSQLST